MSSSPEAPVLQEGSAPSLEFLSCNLDIESRTIWLGNIEEDTAEHFIKAMHLLQRDSDFPITILMHSGGGHWVSALAIYDCIQDCDAPVDIEVYGHCMSAAPVIVQACTTRWISPNATVMIHDGQHGGEGETRTFVSWGKYADNERKRMFKLLSARSTKTPAYWRNRCAKVGDIILTAEQAVACGLFDHVITPHIPQV